MLRGHTFVTVSSVQIAVFKRRLKCILGLMGKKVCVCESVLICKYFADRYGLYFFSVKNFLITRFKYPKC